MPISILQTLFEFTSTYIARYYFRVVSGLITDCDWKNDIFRNINAMQHQNTSSGSLITLQRLGKQDEFTDEQRQLSSARPSNGVAIS